MYHYERFGWSRSPTHNLLYESGLPLQVLQTAGKILVSAAVESSEEPALLLPMPPPGVPPAEVELLVALLALLRDLLWRSP